MKLLIASTQKTGNTWLRHLLSFLYELPSVDVGARFRRGELEALGDDWVCQQHFFPEAGLLEWAEENGAILLTTLRHPADTLLSLWGYVRRFTGDETMDARLIAALAPDGDRMGPTVAAFVRDSFAQQLAISVAWQRTGRSLLVRYEDLWRDPVGTLEGLAEAIAERVPGADVSRDAVERAVALGEIDTLRALPGVVSKFFGQGKVGTFVDRLPADIAEILRTHPPFPEQFAALGYRMDPDDPRIAGPRRERRDRNPFRGAAQLADGTTVCSFLVRAFLTLEGRKTRRFTPTGGLDNPLSFASWLNEPAEADPSPAAEPLLTNLVALTHRVRRDLETKFPDPFGADRGALATWYVRNGVRDLGLDPAFIAPVRESWRRWAVRPSDDLAPPVMNLALAVRAVRDDVADGHPDPLGADRFRLMLWVLGFGPREERLDAALLAPLSAALAEWGARPAEGEPAAPPFVSNLALALTGLHPELSARFPDPLGAHRDAFLAWLGDDGRVLVSMDRFLGIVGPPEREAWENAPADDDPRRGEAVPVVTNLMARIHATRPELASRYPDLFGRDRVGFLAWLLSEGASELALGSAHLALTLASWTEAEPEKVTPAAKEPRVSSATTP